MKPYEKYVPSGVEWIGDIPVGWEVKKLKYLFFIYNGATPKSDNDDFWNGDITWVTPADFSTAQKYIHKSERQITKEGLNSCATKLVPNGSIIISNRAPIGTVGISAVPLTTNQGCKSMVKKTIIDERYIYYFLSTQSTQLNICGKGTTFLELSNSDLSSFTVPLPNADIQTAIANYLDRETARLDNIIKVKETLIERLKEKRTALITHAVTKGLDSNAKMKPSGVAWIGDIPDGWEVKKIKYVAKKSLMYGANESPDDFDETQPRYIRITDIDENGKLRDDIAVSLDIEKAKPYLLKKDDILFARSGATVGKSYIFDQDILACFAGYMIKFEPQKAKIVPKFAYYITFSKMYLNWIESNTIQATIQNVSAEKYNNFYLPLPQVEVQNTIVAFLNSETSKLDTTIEKTKLSIEKLKEYRTALISACVTGKIDVRSV